MTTKPEPGCDRPDPSVLTSERRLISLACRLLGSLADAEDAVQETYARWYALPRSDRDAVTSPAAWLTTVTSRICLNLLGSARARRVTYVGERLPEPPPGRPQWSGQQDPAAMDPADHVTLEESVSTAFLIVLESMTPAERVAFVLHDVFRYSFTEVAQILGRTPAACRQLATSARRRLRAARPAPPAPPTPSSAACASPVSPVSPGSPVSLLPRQRAGLVRDFRQAWRARDIDGLIGLLDPGATATGCAGARVAAAT
ncbi:sigma-70 family RNA polymerase sigma factor [Streptomyces sp. NPDC059063]|uniref:sigma-70 family RNA polymerase sigma factor n=1 Tax=unclassified Streptomyces TaxID=2593676 RepID=UPI0036C7C5A5